jgi:hypothetical protein
VNHPKFIEKEHESEGSGCLYFRIKKENRITEMLDVAIDRVK